MQSFMTWRNGMAKETGGPAFPVPAELCQDLTVEQQRGMTLRDYFAAQAMTGAQIWDAVLNGKNAQLSHEGGVNTLAEVAYAVADAMLKARK
jgi:hypothetical protein